MSIQRIYRSLQSWFYFYVNGLFLKISRNRIDRTALLYISHEDAKDLVYKGKSPQHRFYRNKLSEIGKIEGGNWDQMRVSIRDMSVVKYPHERFDLGIEVLETEYYKLRIQREILKKEKNTKLSKEEIDGIHQRNFNYLCSYDDLILAVKSKGYATNRTLNKKLWADEITFRIGRFGDFLFEDGRHRLSAAIYLKLKKIPVLITWRHADWLKARGFFMQLPESIKQEISSFFIHPDIPGLTKISQSIPNVVAKYQFINVGNFNDSKTLLEIGPRVGLGFFKNYRKVRHYSMLELDNLFYEVINTFLTLRFYSDVSLFHSIGFVSQFHSFFNLIYITSIHYLENDEYFLQLKKLFSFVKCDELYIVKPSGDRVLEKVLEISKMLELEMDVSVGSHQPFLLFVRG